MVDHFGGIQMPKRLVGIFWDIENCAVPKTKSASGVVNHIRNSFINNRLNHREYEFLVACDSSKLREGMADDMNRAGGVTLAHVSGTNKNAADEKIRESMRRFVDTHAFSNSSAPPPILVLISGDIDFVNDLRGYQTRLGCTIILLHNATCSAQFKMGWNELYAFKDFCAAVPDSAPQNGKVPPPPQLPKVGPNSGNPKQDKTKQTQQQQGQGNPNPKGQGQANAKPGGPKPNYENNFQGPRPNGPRPGAGAGFKGQQQPPQGPYPNVKGPRGPAPGIPNGPRQPGPKNASLVGAMNNMSLQSPINPKPKTPPECILMVSGLPGKLDFQILKAHLQEHANQVNGKVKYVKNGQAFITFNHKADATKAISLFHGFETYGKKLNVTVVNNIPFETPNPKKDEGPGSGFVVVKPQPAGRGRGGGGQGQGQNQAPRQMPGQMAPPFDSQLAGYLGQFAGVAIAHMNKSDDAGGKQKKNFVKPKEDPNCTIM